MKKIFALCLIILSASFLFSTSEYEISTTSTLIENIGDVQYEYSVQNLIDNDLTTCWVGSKYTNGIGEEIRFFFNENTYVDKLLLFNGYQKNEDLFYKNNRVNEIELIINEQEHRSFYLYDSNLANVIRINREVKTLSIKIKSIYVGWKYNDTCISEIKFINDNSYVSPYITEASSNNLSKIKSYYLKYITGNLTINDMDILLDEYNKQIEYKNKKSEEYDFEIYRNLLINENFIDSDHYYSEISLIDQLFIQPKSEVWLNKKSMLMKIADKVSLNNIFLDFSDDVYTGDFILDKLFSEHDIIAFEKSNGYPPINMEKSWWYGNEEKIIYNESSLEYDISQLQNFEVNTNQDIEWVSRGSSIWESIYIENPNRVKCNIHLLINESIEIISELEDQKSIYIGINASRVKLNIIFEEEPSTIRISTKFGNNWVELY